MPLSCLIVDDEPLAGQLLADYVEKTPDLTLLSVHTDPVLALQFLRDQTVDVLFLDVQMPEINGLQVARIVGDRSRVVLTTAYENYALEGYDINAVDYLLKPISFARFQRAVNRLLSVEPPPAPAAAPEFIFVKSGHRTHRISLQDLKYGSTGGDYLTLFLSDGSKLLTLENIGDLLERLPSAAFCRIHRSHFVALDKVDFVERRRVVIDEQYLPISESYAEEFWNRIG